MMFSVLSKGESRLWAGLLAIACAALVWQWVTRPAVQLPPRPMAYWYEIGALAVADHVYGEDPVVTYTGEVQRRFSGSYVVLAENAETGAIVQEDRSPIFTYRPDRTRPPEIRLYGWWAPGLARLAPGEYVIETCWTVHEERGTTGCTVSNRFRVAP